MMGWDRERGAPNPYTIYRSRDAMVFGVCAGLADYFGMEQWMVRFFWGFALLILPPTTIVAYLVLTALLPKAPARLYASEEEAEFWRGVRVDPSRSFYELNQRFRALEQRLRRAEAIVTSRSYRLRREIDKLDR